MSGQLTAFVYGTLMDPRVFFRVVQGNSDPPEVIRNLYTFTPAILHGYCRHRVRTADYPGIIPEEGRSVRGIYVTGLTDANIDKLDSFEGDEYERRTVKVKLLEQVGDDDAEGESLVEGEEKTADTYVFIYPDQIERGEWDFEHFRRERLRYWAREEFSFDDAVDEAV
ncbi:hypothetical protein SODALDRAFT_332757 [Sodiomyces alkalinus F11]|uniref:Putative gamma-glutamylcyclotransferase n=1 Tax=Sodiomyces alkalinus (strain CBS 110278 / VKM F-3762 / F11) TaxID=1314773 RepID=A0A3N2PXQ8_SODAK|nr:hypothetical protein SODALDRAFT_332757 [Sodiomyces alkalinus F11]ROT39319.1 hypothetical protein SODALDRAFT_332757 [Sodiomyces alkalinus F11]